MELTAGSIAIRHWLVAQTLQMQHLHPQGKKAHQIYK